MKFDPKVPEEYSDQQIADYLNSLPNMRNLHKNMRDEVIRRTKWVTEYYDEKVAERGIGPVRYTVMRNGWKTVDDLPRCPNCNIEPARPFEDRGKLTACCSRKCANEFRTKRSTETNLKRYGVENPFQSREVQNKIKETNLKRYGSENPFGSEEIKEKIKSTNLERYGVENYSQTQEWRDAIVSSNLSRYGVGFYFQTEEFKKKTKETNLRKYGHEHPMSNEAFRDRFKEIMVERYGSPNAMQVPKFLEKAKLTNLERYGTEYYIHAEEFKRKTKETNLKKYGSEWAIESDIVREKIDETLEERYGGHYMKLDEFKEKVANTNLKKYGRESFAQTYLSDETLSTLENKEELQTLYEAVGVEEMSRLLDCSDVTIYNYLRKHSIEVHKWTNVSSGETSLYEAIRELYPDAQQSNRTIIKPKEIDIFIPSKRIGIEYNGNYWHSSEHKEGEHFQEKTLDAMERGVRLIHIFEDEWTINRDDTLEMIVQMIEWKYEEPEEEEIVLDLRWESPLEYIKNGWEISEDLEPKTWFVEGGIRLEESMDPNSPTISDCGYVRMVKK